MKTTRKVEGFLRAQRLLFPFDFFLRRFSSSSSEETSSSSSSSSSSESESSLPEEEEGVPGGRSFDLVIYPRQRRVGGQLGTEKGGKGGKGK